MNYPKLIKPINGTLSQRYGARPEFYKKYGLKYHEGTDYAAPEGTPVYSVSDGMVHQVGASGGNYGISVRVLSLIDGECYMFIYAHLSEVCDIRKGDLVKQGQVIALSGNTGLSSGPHLHFGVKMFDATRRGIADQPTDIMNSDKFFEKL